MASGILVAGKLTPFAHAAVLGPGEQSWLTIQARDGRKRTTIDPQPQMITNHTTKGLWPQKIVPGSPTYDAVLRCKQIADDWRIGPRGSKLSGSAAFIVCGKFVVQLVDPVVFITYHAGQNEVNTRSIGIEMVQEADGSLHSDTLDTTVELNVLLADACGIPFQVHGVIAPANDNAKAEVPVVRRLRQGGADCCGVFGHRDNSWIEPEWLPLRYQGEQLERMRRTYPDGYGDRGRGDPGDEIVLRLKRRGALSFDFHQRQDLAWWMRVQHELNLRFGANLREDGVCGPRTVAEMRRRGLWNGGIWAEFPFP